MRLRTRLLIPLVATVTAVMALYATWALRQRESTLLAEDRREAVTFASALGLALEAALVDPEWRGVQDVIQRLTRDPQIQGIRVYDRDGVVAYESETLSGLPSADSGFLTRVLEQGDTAAFEREVDDERMQVLLRPLRGEGGESIGAFELTLGLSFVEAEMARTRTRFLLNTVTLVAALTVLTFWLVRRQIDEPLGRLVTGVQAVGAGELTFRIQEDPRAADLAVVAREFNSMAERLEVAREDLMREADERVALERRFRESDKLAAVGRLAAGLAHEIATPLQIIKGRTDMLEHKQASMDVYARNVRIIGEQIDRVTALVRGLLDLSRRPELHVRRIDLADLLLGVADLLEAELERSRIRLELDVHGELAIDGDGNLLHQVVMNLMLNAIQALEGSGEGRIVLRGRAVTGGASRIGLGSHAVRVVVEVEDNGPGIPEEALERIFEPFYSTKQDAHGTGLGLSVARSVAEEHGGVLWAENVTAAPARPAGARFTLELPAAGMEDADDA